MGATLSTAGATLSSLATYLTPTRPAPAPPIRARPAAPPSIPAAEEALLSHLTDTPYQKRLIRLPSGHVINTLSAGDPSAPPLLLLHGWGAGAAFFGRNVAALARTHRLHVVDWLGFGASSRPAHPLSLSPEQAEAFFVDALGEWVDVMRELEGLRDMHVVGHSMGAFLSVSYALRHPRRVRNLVLASPVGLPRAPAEKIPTGGLVRRAVFWALFRLWEAGFTPQLMLRLAGARAGRWLADCMMAPRFATRDPATRAAFAEYFYQISVARGSGEYALSTVLESGAYARRPLCDRMHEVAVPTMFLYGDRDWMTAGVARKVRQGMSVETRVEVVTDAGHHLYYDNAAEFGRLVLEACTEVAQRESAVA